MSRVKGKVALITGGARGVGRALAARLAREGADIVVLDVAGPVRDTGYSSPSSADLEETLSLVKTEGRRGVAHVADVRDQAALDAIVADTVATFGRLDIVAVNAGIMGAGLGWEISEQEWDDIIAVNLTGAWKTVKACAPAMISAGNGGSIVMTSSVAGLKSAPFCSHYAASKHGMVGLMKALANELAPHNIRVNTVNPTGIASSMGNIPRIIELFEMHPEQVKSYGNALPVARVEPIDIANAVLFLASDEARYITGVSLPVDAGALNI